MSIFDQYTRKAPPQEAHPVEKEAAPVVKAPYQAYAADAPRTKVTRLMLRYPDGTLGLMAYAYLIEAISTSHEFLSLVFTNCIITLEGRNLTKLLNLLQEERILEMYCFDPRQHEASDADEALIIDMERRSLQEMARSKVRAEAE